MRKVALILVVMFATLNLMGQTDGLSYQAVIISQSTQQIIGKDIVTGNIVPNEEVNVRFTITNANEQIEYQEIQSTKTDDYGMINLVIGEGLPLTDSHFTGIHWDGTRKDLLVEINIYGTTFIELSYQTLLFIPYSLHRDISATGSLTVDGPTTLKGTLQLNAPMTINATVEGEDSDFNSYILKLEGNAQGIAIKVNEGTPDNTNNYITFFDNVDNAIGRIEGQTDEDLASSAQFIFETAMYTADVVAAGVNIILSLLPNTCAGVGVVACPPDPSAIAMAIVDELLAIANLAAYEIFAFTNLGVTYQSGSADYAEWLERLDHSEQIRAGDIVGVFGGKITKNTTFANQYLVASTNPAILGNMPELGNDEFYEKIAFMGQVPVKVRGNVNIGDYIIPSGINDGTGISVSPVLISSDQYQKVVGIAWSATSIGSTISVVNMAIGLNTNDVAKFISEQSDKIENLENDLAALDKRILAIETGKEQVLSKASIPKGQLQEQIASVNLSYTLDVDLVEEAIILLENTYRERGIDIDNHPGLKKLFNDHEYRMDIILKIRNNYEANKTALFNAN